MNVKPENDISLFDIFLQGLTKILLPVEEALKLREALNVHTLEETAVAARRARCEVSYVDLPEKVSGFAAIIEGKPHIALNRDKPRKDLEYTLPHELGHLVLHLNPAHGIGQPECRNIPKAEFEAHLFAATWVNSLGNDRQRDELLAENREASAASVGCFIMLLAVVVIAILAWVYSKLFNAQPLILQEAK
jgi:hypothetical protein